MTMKDMGKKIVQVAKKACTQSKFLVMVPVTAGLIAFSTQSAFSQTDNTNAKPNTELGKNSANTELKIKPEIKEKLQEEINTILKDVKSGVMSREDGMNKLRVIAQKVAGEVGTMDLAGKDAFDIAMSLVRDCLGPEGKKLYDADTQIEQELDSLNKASKAYNKTRLATAEASMQSGPVSYESTDYFGWNANVKINYPLDDANNWILAGEGSANILGIVDDISVSQSATNQFRGMVGFYNLKNSRVNGVNPDNTKVLVGIGSRQVTNTIDSSFVSGMFFPGSITYSEGPMSFNIEGSIEMVNGNSAFEGLNLRTTAKYYYKPEIEFVNVTLGAMVGQELSNNSVNVNALRNVRYNTTIAGVSAYFVLDLSRLEAVSVNFETSTEYPLNFMKGSVELDMGRGWKVGVSQDINNFDNLNQSKTNFRVGKTF